MAVVVVVLNVTRASNDSQETKINDENFNESKIKKNRKF